MFDILLIPLVQRRENALKNGKGRYGTVQLISQRKELAKLEMRDGRKAANDKRADVVLNSHFVALRPFQRD